MITQPIKPEPAKPIGTATHTLPIQPAKPVDQVKPIASNVSPNIAQTQPAAITNVKPNEQSITA